MLRVTDDGGLYILNCMFNGTAVPAQLRLLLCTAALAFTDSTGADFITADAAKLFAVTTAPTDELGNITISEVAGPGYAAALIDAAENAVSLTADGIPEALWVEQVFTLTAPLDGGVTIYGYQIAAVAPASGNPILFEGLLTSPYTPPPLGGTVKITPQVLFGNGTPT